MQAREVVPDSVTGSETDPLWDGSVLLLGSGELDLCSEGLVALEGRMSVSLLFSVSIASSRTLRRLKDDSFLYDNLELDEGDIPAS
jgi:hypothetical protein